MTEGIWQILTGALESLEDFHFNGLLMSKTCILFVLRKCRGVIFHETVEEYKTSGGIDLSFQNWDKNFDNFWPEYFKVSNVFPLMGFFSGKYILLELKNYRWVIFHETEGGYKIWRGINLSFKNMHKEFVKFWPEHSKFSKIFTLMGSYEQSIYCLSQKSTVE